MLSDPVDADDMTGQESSEGSEYAEESESPLTFLQRQSLTCKMNNHLVMNMSN